MPAFATTRPDECGSEKLLLGLNTVTVGTLDDVAVVVVNVDVVVSLAVVVVGNSFTLLVFFPLEAVVAVVVVGPPPLFPLSLLVLALIKLSIAPRWFSG